MSKADRLAALRKKLAAADIGGPSGFFRSKEGRNTVRILPEVGGMEAFYQPVGIHNLPNKKRIYCPAFTTEGELECPVCELVQELYSAGDKTSRSLAGDMRVRRKFWMNVIDRENEKAGPVILTAGVTIFTPIVSLIGDPDYGDITDVDTGTDIVIKRTGSGIETSYDVIGRRNESILGEDDEIDEWLEKAKDLTCVVLSEDPEEDVELKGSAVVWVLPYNRIVEEYDLDFMNYNDDEEPEEEEVNEVKEEVKQVKRRRSSRRRRR